jgi:iron complex transport system substrate-binding protein
VSELIEIAGGQDVFAHLSKEQGAKSRILDPSAIIDAAPDVIIASWCGKKVVIDKIKRRAGWDAIPAVKNDLIFEIKSPLILQPGPAALTDGLDRLCDIMRHARRSLDEKEPAT